MSQEGVPQVPESLSTQSMTEALAASGAALAAELKVKFIAASETMTLSEELQQEANELLGTSFGQTEATTPTYTQNSSSFMKRTAESLKAKARKVVIGGVIGAMAMSTVGGTLASAQAPSPTPTPKTARQMLVAKLKSDKTVAQTVKDFDDETATPQIISENVRLAFEMGPKQEDHRNGAENSVASVFPDGHIGPINSLYQMALGAAANNQELAQVYNPLHGGSEDNTSLPAGVSVQQARTSVEDALSSLKATHRIEYPGKPTPKVFHNHGGRDNGDIFSAGNMTLDGHEKMFVFTTPGGKEIFQKITGEDGIGDTCGNLGAVATLHLVEQIPAQVRTFTVPSPETPAPVTPKPEHHRHHHQRFHFIKRIHREEQTVTTTTTTNTTTTPPSQQPPKPNINNIKNNNLPPAGPTHTDQSGGTPSAPEGSKPVPTQASTTSTETTTTQAAQPTIPENNAPTSTEPTTSVNSGTSTSTPGSSDSSVGGVTSTAPNPNGSGTEGQGGPVASADTTTSSSTSTTSSN